MDAALDQARAEGFDVRDEDVVRLSPLGFDHINMLGRYAFVLPDTVAGGQRRPPRNPSLANDDDLHATPKSRINGNATGEIPEFLRRSTILAIIIRCCPCLSDPVVNGNPLYLLCVRFSG
jgi:hypothetical protein